MGRAYWGCPLWVDLIFLAKKTMRSTLWSCSLWKALLRLQRSTRTVGSARFGAGLSPHHLYGRLLRDRPIIQVDPMGVCRRFHG